MIHIVVGCDSDWFGFPCRGRYPSTEQNIQDARVEALGHGWSLHLTTGAMLCPAHTYAAAGQGREQ